MKKATLQNVCAEIVSFVDGALGCAFAHLETGLPLASSVRAGSRFGATAVEVLCAAGTTYFGESAVDGSRVEELQATTMDAYLFISLVPGSADGLLILAIDRDATNLGLGWLAMRRALDAVREANARLE